MVPNDFTQLPGSGTPGWPYCFVPPEGLHHHFSVLGRRTVPDSIGPHVALRVQEGNDVRMYVSLAGPVTMERLRDAWGVLQLDRPAVCTDCNTHWHRNYAWHSFHPSPCEAPARAERLRRYHK